MIGEYRVNRCTRHCHKEGRPLREGEVYYSVVLESGDDYVRQDYSASAWDGPPDESIGWWKNRMPTADEKKLVLAPPEVLIDLLRQMEAFPDKAKIRYLMALMLMRKRMLRPGKITERAVEDPVAGGAETERVSRFEVIADGSTIDVVECVISKSESETLREQLNELLYCEVDETLDDEEPMED